MQSCYNNHGDKMKTIVIIGGGASGLVAAISAKTSSTNVILLERNAFCGKKILATGNGRCNYWNSDQDLNHYNSTNHELLQDIITKSNQEEILNFFSRIGIIPKIKNGYYYPYSNQALSIRDALITEASQVGVKIHTSSYVENIRKENSKYIISVNNESIIADAVIIATGSKASPKTGSDGNGYNLAKKLGHTVIEPLPALVQLVGNEKYFKDWNGIRCEAKISLFSNNQLVKENLGELQLTDYGISGICTFNLSRFVSRNIKEHQLLYVAINFLPFIENDALDWLAKRNEIVKNRTIFELLEGLLNPKLIKVILKICNLTGEEKWDSLKGSEKNLLIEKLTNLKVKIIGTKSFDQAQTCSGGIPLSEINTKTMESTINKNLYFVGELLDVDGDCGGYNLGFAWISGLIAGKSSRS